MRTLLPEEMKTRREDGNDDEHQEKKGHAPADLSLQLFSAVGTDLGIS